MEKRGYAIQQERMIKINIFWHEQTPDQMHHPRLDSIHVILFHFNNIKEFAKRVYTGKQFIISSLDETLAPQHSMKHEFRAYSHPYFYITCFYHDHIHAIHAK